MQPRPEANQSSKPEESVISNWPPSLARLVLGALFAAGLSFALLKFGYPVFQVPPEIAYVPETAPIEAQWKLEAAEFVVDGKNFSLFFALIGAILAASCVVFSFGFKRVSVILIAVLASAALGYLGANLSNWMFTNLRLSSSKELIFWGFTLDGVKQTIIGFGSLWCLIGLGAGIGVGAMHSVGKSLTAGIAGFCGGAVAAMLYVILTMQLSIGTTMNRVFPLDDSRLAIWLVVFQVAIGACIALGLGERKRKVVA